MDENYLVVGNFIEDHIRERIENGEYVDFSRLLPRDRLLAEEDNRMEIVNRNGKTYFVPAVDMDPSGITNFSCWEQAFRVFSKIYTRRFPSRASELIQYNQVIYTAALSFTWENVYLYDRDFRLHLSRFPNRLWSVILQQAWTMRLKDHNQGTQGSSSKGGRGGKSRKDNICWRYNSGHCTYGGSCKFEHRCAICNKFGHGAHICRKANNFQHNSFDNGHGGSGHGNGGNGKGWYNNENNNNHHSAAKNSEDRKKVYNNNQGKK